MRRIALTILLIACLFPAEGCHWAGLRDPVPAALTASRKLSSEGNKLLEQNEPEKAEAKLLEAVNACPSDCDARRYYAESLWLRNARPEAVAQLEEACRLKPDSDLRVRLAEMYLEMGRLDEASRNIDYAVGKNRNLAAAWRVRGRVFRLKGDRLLGTPPEQWASSVCARDASESNRTLDAGIRNQARACYLQALADLHRAAGYDPADRQVMGETAAVYRSLGQPQRALETMQSLAETYSPGEEPQQVLYWAGLDYMAQSRYDDAVATLSTALTRGRPTPEIYYSLGKAQYGSGRSSEAAAALEQALVIDPQHRPSRQLLGQIEVARQGEGTVWR